MNHPLISVVMTVYNTEKYLAESINSVLNQTYTNLQFIIIDDGSTDKSPEILRKLSDPRIEVYTLSENRHISYATNYGFSKVKGEYLAIMDSDDLWVPDKLEKQLEFLRSHPEHKGCFAWVDLIDEKGNLINDRFLGLRELFAAKTETQEYWLRFFFFHGNRLNNPSSLVAAETIDTIGGHNLFYIQATDMDWWVRFTQKYSFGIIEEPLIKYRRIQNSDASVSSNSEVHDTRFYNEFMHIRYHFFDTMDDDLFIRTFKGSFRNPDSKTTQELACEKAFLILQSFNDSSCYTALGLLKLEELLNNTETAVLLKEKFNFSTKECGIYTGSHIYNDPYMQKLPKKVQELENWNSLCQLHIGKQDQKIFQLNKQVEDLISLLSEKETTIKYLLQRIKEQEESMKALTDTLTEITNSNSWKITSPLRKFKDKWG